MDVPLVFGGTMLNSRGHVHETFDQHAHDIGDQVLVADRSVYFYDSCGNRLELFTGAAQMARATS